ncbi:MAG TPA: succinate dehydrogenase, hydrophobic membrane anchor protein [Steroidobacteraceae bacterium]|nr:succinate dehydrogenase, hydrophobic membrane anchor protein [Steroidobacteraceae bacterium]
MSLRTPLGRVLGRGSAGDGVGHWWEQRVTAIALIPLSAWFAVSLVRRHAGKFEDMQAWLSQPWPALLALLLVVALAWHSKLGVQVVIEDYIHAKGAKTTLLVLSTFLHFAAAFTGIFAILRLALA